MNDITSFFALEHAYAYGYYVGRARHLTEAEKGRYKPEFHDSILIAIDENIKLPEITIDDLPTRRPDGS